MISSSCDVFRVPSDCDPVDVKDILSLLRQQVATASPGKPLALELTDGRPTAIALQLVASAALSLSRKAAFAGYGATAAPILSPLTDR
jgi:hypothetical protein